MAPDGAARLLEHLRALSLRQDHAAEACEQ